MLVLGANAINFFVTEVKKARALVPTNIFILV
jgi:hypothetical protein